MLDKSYVDIDAHLAAAYANKLLGDAGSEQLHRSIAQGLLASILKSGDGKTAATAWKVIAVEEEYEILRAGRLRPSSQAETPANGHWYDKLTALDAKDAKVTLYFNIDLVHEREIKAFGLT